MVTKNPFKTVKKPGIFDLRSYFPDTISLKTLYDSMYEGDTKEERAEQRHRNQNNPVWLRSSKKKLRQVFLKHFGVDPFVPGFRWDKQVKVTRGRLGQPAREVTIGTLSMRDAMRRWGVERKQQVSRNKIFLDGKWVDRTPENMMRRLQMRMARKPAEADDGRLGWVSYDEAKKIFPAYDRTFIRYLDRHRGHVPGVPYKMLTEMARQAAFARILADFRKKKYRGMTLQQYWNYLKQTSEHLAHGKVGEGGVGPEADIPPDPPPGPVLDQLLQKKKQYERDREAYFRKHQSKVPEYVREILERKGVKRPPKEVTLIHGKQTMTVPEGSIFYKAMIKSGWRVASSEDLRKAGVLVGAGVAPIPPRLSIDLRERMRTPEELDPTWMRREKLIPPGLGRKLSRQTQRWWDALGWAQESGLGGLFGRLAKLRPSKNAYEHLFEWHKAHREALKNPPKPGTFTPFNRLGPYGIGKWFAMEGFADYDEFTSALEKRLLPQKLRKIIKKMKDMGVSEADLERGPPTAPGWSGERLRLWERYKGIKTALRMAKLHRQERLTSRIRRTLPDRAYNSLGVFSVIRAGDYLRAAYYDRFFKRQSRTKKGRRWEVSPNIRDFVGLWGPPRFFRPSETPGGEGGEEVLTGEGPQAWGQALARGLQWRGRTIDWRIRAAAIRRSRSAAIRNPLDLISAMGQGAISAMLNIGSLAAGMVEGAGEYIGHSLGAWRSGRRKKDIRWLTPLTASNLTRLGHSLAHSRGNVEWKKFAAGRWVMAARTAEQQTALMMDEYVKKKLGQNFLTNTVENAGEIIEALSQLPGIFLGPQFEEFLKLSPDWVTRYQKALELGQGFGKQMGYGFGKFIHMLVSDPGKMARAAPIDSLIMWYPVLKRAMGTPAYLAQSPKVRAIVEKVYLASKKVFEAADARVFGGRLLPVWTKMSRASSNTLYRTLRLMGPVGHWANRMRAKARTFADEAYLHREAHQRALWHTLYTTIGGEEGLRGIAMSLPALAKRGNPLEILEVIDMMERGIPASVLKKSPDLARAFAEGRFIAEQGAHLSGMKIPRGRRARFTYFRKLAGETFSGFLEILRQKVKGVTRAAKSKRLKRLGEDLAAYLGPKTTVLEYGSKSLKRKGASMPFYPRWQAADWVHSLITDSKFTGLIADKLNVSPTGAIAHLKKIRAAIDSGDLSGTKWLLGADLSGDLLSNRSLGRMKLFFGWLGANKHKRLGVIQGLAKKLSDPAVKKRVLGGIDKLIKDMGRFEGIHGRILKNLGIDPGSWRFFSRKEFASLPLAHQPGVFVPKSFNKLMIAHFERGMGARVPAPALRRAFEDMTGGQMVKLLDEINSAIRKKYSRLPRATVAKMEIKVPAATDRAALMAKFGRLSQMIGEGMPKPLAAFIEKVYEMSGDRWLKLMDAIEAKNAGVLTTLEKTFHADLKNHGALVAIQNLFKHKVASGDTALRSIANMPGVLRLLPAGADGARAIQALRSMAARELLSKKKKKKRFAGSLEEIKRALNNAALRIEGGQVRSFIDSTSPPRGSLQLKAMLDPSLRPKFIEMMLKGKSPDVLPTALYRSPDAIIADLLANKQKLMDMAKSNHNVSKQKFLYVFEGVMRRLRHYDEVPVEYRAALGMRSGEDRMYVPTPVINGLKYMYMAQEQLGPIVSWAKRNLTTRRLVTFMNNLTSSVMLQATRVGRFVNPYKDHKLVAALSAEGSVAASPVRAKARSYIAQLLKDKKLTQADLHVYRDIVGLKKFLEMGAFELEMGGLRGFSKWNPLQRLEKAYSYTDKGFKFHDAVRGHRWMSRGWNLEKVGGVVRFERAPGVWVKIRKTKDLSQSRRGRHAIVGEIIGQDGSVIKSVTGEGLSKMFARSSATMADRAFVNYGSLAKALAVMRSKGVNVLGVFAPFLTWAYKATYIPGVKSGIPQMMFRPYPNMTFSGKAARTSALADMQAASLRANLLLQMGRQQLLALPQKDLREIMEAIPGEMRPTFIRMLGDAEVIGTKDLGWLSFLGPTQLFFGLVKSMSVDAIKKQKLMGGDNSLFAKHWLGPKGNLMLNLRGEKAVAAGYATKSGELTEKGKKLLKLRKFILSQAAKPSGRRTWDIAQVLLMTGGIGKDFVEILMRASSPNAREYKILPEVVKSAMTLTLGGTIQGLTDAVIGIAAPKSIFTSRSLDPVTDRVEGSIRFAIRRLSGLGLRYTRTSTALDRYFKRIGKAWRAALIGEKREKGSIRWGIANGNLQIEDLKKRIKAAETVMSAGKVKAGFMQSERGKKAHANLEALKAKLKTQVSIVRKLWKKSERIEAIVDSELYKRRKKAEEMLRMVAAQKAKMKGRRVQGKLRVERLGHKKKTLVEQIYDLGPVPMIKVIKGPKKKGQGKKK
jgi:hypothetical protein